MNKSESITNLAKALNSFQSKITAVKKDAINPFYKSKYATLDTIWESIRKPLSENGLSVTQTMGILQGTPIMALLETTLYHTSGEWISGTQLVNPIKDDPQSLGSAISYARRYSLSAILGIVADEDDDGNIATKPKAKEESKTAEKPVPPIAETIQRTEPKISTAQTKKIYTLVKEGSIPIGRIKAYIKDTFKKTLTKELTVSEASRLIENIEAGKLDKSALIDEAKRLGAVEIKKGGY